MASATVLRDLAWTIHRRIPEGAGFHPLPTTELAVLKHVLDSPGITVSELSRHLGLRQSNTSAAVRTLTERGLLAREPKPTDRRATLLIPTDTSQSEHSTIASACSGAIETALGQLDVGHVAAIAAAAPALAALDRAMHDQQTEQPG